jgi:RNA polymerase sigma factor (sigma-70 family)
VEEPLGLVQGDDQPLVAQIEGFESFVERNHERLYGALCLLTKDRYEAEEIAQEAFVRIFERWDRVRRVDDPTAYLFRTAMNVFRKRYRRATLALKRTLSVVPRDDFVERIEAEDLVVRAVAQLPTDQRAALIATSLLGCSSDEAAQILGVRSSTVRAGHPGANGAPSRDRRRTMIDERPNSSAPSGGSGPTRGSSSASSSGDAVTEELAHRGAIVAVVIFAVTVGGAVTVLRPRTVPSMSRRSERSRCTTARHRRVSVNPRHRVLSAPTASARGS